MATVSDRAIRELHQFIKDVQA
jgi:hypothetical protein